MTNYSTTIFLAVNKKAAQPDNSIQLNLKTRTVCRKLGSKVVQIKLSPQRFRFAYYVFLNANKVLSKPAIIEFIYEDDFTGGPDCANNNYAVLVTSFRRLFAPLGVTLIMVRQETLLLKINLWGVFPPYNPHDPSSIPLTPPK